MSKKGKGFVAEFKKFIMRGNVIDLAVGVIIGGAFQAIVNSLVNDIVMPLLGSITGGLDFSEKSLVYLDSFHNGVKHPVRHPSNHHPLKLIEKYNLSSEQELI